MLNSVSAAVESTGADEVLLCWDGGRSVRRLSALPEYKAHRSSTTLEQQERMEKVWDQSVMVDSLFLPMGSPVFRHGGVEGDDVVALLALSVADEGDRDAIILSNDKDFLQLVQPGITLLSGAGSSQEKVWQYGKVKNHLIGVSSLTSKALTGCASDGIPGVKGIGGTRADALRDSVMADGVYPWTVETLHKVISGEYDPPAPHGDRNVTKAVALLRASPDINHKILDRNAYLCDLNFSAFWPEVVDCAMSPRQLQNTSPEERETNFLGQLQTLGWKHEQFRGLSRVWGI